MKIMKKKNNTLSQDEADTFISFAKKVLDVIVDMTGGKPSFGGKN
mgnify:CR=1 FL=1